jgi:hypothetical protein
LRCACWRAGRVVLWMASRQLLSEVQLQAEVAALAPPGIEFEPAMFVVNERQIHNVPPGDGEIPATVRIGNLLRIPSASHRLFVSNTDHVIAEIREWVAQMPGEVSCSSIRPIPGRRPRFVHVSKPPDRIQLVVKMNGRQVGARRHDDAVPFWFWLGDIGPLRLGWQRAAAREQRSARDKEKRAPEGGQLPTDSCRTIPSEAGQNHICGKYPPKQIAQTFHFSDNDIVDQGGQASLDCKFRERSGSDIVPPMEKLLSKRNSTASSRPVRPSWPRLSRPEATCHKHQMLLRALKHFAGGRNADRELSNRQRCYGKFLKAFF